jgi:hypothetical protein
MQGFWEKYYPERVEIFFKTGGPGLVSWRTSLLSLQIKFISAETALQIG